MFVYLILLFLRDRVAVICVCVCVLPLKTLTSRMSGTWKISESRESAHGGCEH